MAGIRLRWAVNIKQWNPTSVDFPLALACIQPEERARINQFVFSEDAVLSLVGRLMLRASTVHIAGTGNIEIDLGRSDRGRPFVARPVLSCPYDINVSHQGYYVVLAAEPDRKVGVDVMQLTRPRGIGTLQEFFSTMNRQFTANEWTQIQAPPTDSQKLAVFYRHWCLKESYIKAVGTGLSHGLQRIDFKLNSCSNWALNEGIISDTEVCVDGVKLREWLFEESLLDEEHCVSVAVQRSCDVGSTPVPFEQISVPYLISMLTRLRDPDEFDWSLHLKRPCKLVKDF